MSYTGTTPKDLDLSTPDGAAEYGNILDDAIIEVKKVFKYSQAINTVTTDTTLDATYSFVLLNKGTAISATLPTASDVSSSTFTKEYRIKNIGAGTGTIIGTVTLNGTATVNPTLAQYDEIYIWTNGTTWYGMKFTDENVANCVVMTTSAGVISVPVATATAATTATTATQLTDGTYNIRVKLVNIGDWNMNISAAVTVNHGLTLSGIRSVTGVIRNDAGSILYPITLASSPDSLGGVDVWISSIDSTSVTLARLTSGDYDGSNFDSTGYNRGYLVITFIV